MEEDQIKLNVYFARLSYKILKNRLLLFFVRLHLRYNMFLVLLLAEQPHHHQTKNDKDGYSHRNPDNGCITKAIVESLSKRMIKALFLNIGNPLNSNL